MTPDDPNFKGQVHCFSI